MIPEALLVVPKTSPFLHKINLNSNFVNQNWKCHRKEDSHGNGILCLRQSVTV